MCSRSFHVFLRNGLFGIACRHNVCVRVFVYMYVWLGLWKRKSSISPANYDAHLTSFVICIAFAFEKCTKRISREKPLL